MKLEIGNWKLEKGERRMENGKWKNGKMKNGRGYERERMDKV
jgi:hypothetical protein